MYSSQEIIDRFNSIINQYGGAYPNWYVGITDDPGRRFMEHGVTEGGSTAYLQAYSEAEARDAEKHFVDLGTQGDTGGGDNPTYVYIFKVS